MKKLIIISFLFCYSLSFSQLAVDSLDINNIKAPVSPIGLLFAKLGTNSFKYGLEYPNGSGKYLLASSALWFGGLDTEDTIRICVEKHRQQSWSYTPGPIPLHDALPNDSISAAWNRVWKLSRTEIDDFRANFHNPDYIIPNSILEWPAHGPNSDYAANIAPWFDIDADGIYNPRNGDYPIIKGDKCLFFVFNDLISSHPDYFKPIGIEVYAMVYAFTADNPHDPFNNSIFVNYVIYNRRTNVLHDAYLGVFSDFDLGNPYDDALITDVGRNSIIAYNRNESDGPAQFGNNSYGNNPPTIAYVLLKGPKADNDNTDNLNTDCFYNNATNCNDGIVDNELLGLTRSIYCQNTGGGNPATQDPVAHSDCYNFLKGYWKDNSPFSYGGTGHRSGGAVFVDNGLVPARYAFPGNSDTLNYCGTNGLRLSPWWFFDQNRTDVRAVGISGPFSFNTSDKIEVEYAYVVARDPNAKSSNSIDLLKNSIDYIRDAYGRGKGPDNKSFEYTYANPINAKSFAFAIYPNPANNVLNLELINSLNENFVDITITDIQGKVIYINHLNLSSETNLSTIDISGFNNGLYVISLKTNSSSINKRFTIIR